MKERIVLMASGTRGDVQPMVALGKELKAAGYRVRIVAGSNFASWLREHELEHWPTVDVEALMRSELGLAWVEGSNQFTQMRAMVQLMDSVREKATTDALESTRDADVIVTGFVMESLMHAVQQSRKTPVLTAALQPYRATNVGEASMMPVLSQRTSRLNRWSGAVAERIMQALTWKSVVLARNTLGLRNLSYSELQRALRTVPALYAISRHVTPTAPDNNATVTGYWFLDESFTPSHALETFLNAGESPVYFGFGSMPGRDPQKIVSLVAESLSTLGLRGIIARGWGQSAPIALPDNMFVLDGAPHNWLFPRVRAVVHHGGAGTTAAGLRAGRPSLLIPHMADQFYWGRRVYELSLGPQPLRRGELSKRMLTQRLQQLVTTASYDENARSIARAIEHEQGIPHAIREIEKVMSARSSS